MKSRKAGRLPASGQLSDEEIQASSRPACDRADPDP